MHNMTLVSGVGSGNSLVRHYKPKIYQTLFTGNSRYSGKSLEFGHFYRSECASMQAQRIRQQDIKNNSVISSMDSAKLGAILQRNKMAHGRTPKARMLSSNHTRRNARGGVSVTNSLTIPRPAFHSFEQSGRHSARGAKKESNRSPKDPKQSDIDETILNITDQYGAQVHQPSRKLTPNIPEPASAMSQYDLTNEDQ
jgi:hypothetical protein